MAACSAITKSGAKCKALPIRGEEYCRGHHPDYEEQRRHLGAKGGRRGGRGRPMHETRDIKALLEDLTDRVLEGELLTSQAAVANQLINTRLRAIETERKIKETEELESRIEALELRSFSSATTQKGARRWPR
jgi:hypothetical protein